MTYFIGSWEGNGTGKWGVSTAERVYEPVLQGKFLRFKHKSTYEPQEKNPEGEVYEEWSFVSYDNTRSTFVLRQFNIEGFVTRYILDSLSTDGRTFVFVSERTENLPSDFGARISYHIVDGDEFRQTFELAFPGKELAVYVENVWTRRK